MILAILEANDTVKYIADRIEQLVKAMSPAAERVWSVLVKQSIVEGWQKVFLAVGCCAVIITLVGLFLKAVGKKCGDGEHLISPGSFIFGLFVVVGFFILMLCCAYAAIGRFANPEFYAIQRLMERIP